MLRVIFAAWIGTAAALLAQTVEGRVVNSATGAGIAGVDVNLVQGGITAYSATTDSQGRFRIEAVKDGTYIAHYKAPSFWPVPGFLGTGSQPLFRVALGSDPVHLETKLQPIGKISGRVLDAAGKPVPNAGLWLHWENSQCRMPMCVGFAHQSKTDAKGEYSIADLDAPGTWLVSATAPSSLNPPEPGSGSQPGSGSHEDQRLGWAQTFYPGVTDPQLAARVMTGGELWLDIKLAAVPVHRIRGVVLDVRGDPVPKVTVTLSKGIDSPSLHANTRSDGTFEFDSVADDEWRMFAKADQSGVKLCAAQGVQVRDRDLDNVELRLAAPFSIQGKIVMEVPESVPAPKPPGITVAFNPGAARLTDAPEDGYGNPDANGDFTIPALYPGPYQIVPGPPPASYYLDSIRLADRDALESDVQILSGFERVTVSYRLGGGTVRGAIEACAAGDVLLIPQDSALRRPGFIRRTTCVQNDRFEILDVRPGEYFALAIGADSPTPWYAAILDELLLSQASKITVRANESSSPEIRLITR
jgi:uncharacterized GH25 family protein